MFRSLSVVSGLLVLLILFSLAPVSSAKGDSLSVCLFDAGYNEGISGLTVKVTPTDGSADPYIEKTDHRGSAIFYLDNGSYELEIFDSDYPAYKGTIEVGDTSRQITLLCYKNVSGSRKCEPNN